MGSKFDFFIPAEITKGRSEEGDDIMKIGGIASTPHQDSDGEFLDPKGFDLSYFLKSGYLNWNHQSKNSPKAIVGEPTKAYVSEDGMHLEGLLYKGSDLAQEVFELANTLEKSSNSRRLGFSIEGKVLERDKANPKKVLKAKITGCAITPTPKNYHTLAEIIKGEVDFDEETILIPESDTDGLLIDITKPSGERITVDKSYNINIIKSDSVDEEDEDDGEDSEKSLNTSSGSALMPESVDGSKENIKVLKKNRKLTKGEAFIEILSKYPELTSDEVDQVFLLANKIEQLKN